MRRRLQIIFRTIHTDSFLPSCTNHQITSRWSYINIFLHIIPPICANWRNGHTIYELIRHYYDYIQYPILPPFHFWIFTSPLEPTNSIKKSNVSGTPWASFLLDQLSSRYKPIKLPECSICRKSKVGFWRAACLYFIPYGWNYSRRCVTW